MKLITGICPNKKMKRFIDKGYERLNIELDLMSLIKDHIKHHKVYRNQTHLHVNDDSLDID